MTTHPWIAERMQHFDSSGIRKVFDLAASMTDPINLSIGQPDFAVPGPIQEAAVRAIHENKNGYSPTQGIAPLREKLKDRIRAQYNHVTRDVVVTSGTSGGLVLAILALVNPGDEVIVFDPYFVMYHSLVGLAGGVSVLVDTYPDFKIDVNRVADAITPRTKAILFNSPANPTGVIAGEEEIRALAQLAAERNVALVSDEIYSLFCYDRPFISPARYNPQTLVIDGFSKTYGMTGWRLGYAHGPAEVISQMIKLQQYTFVCAPQPSQWAGIAALEVDMSQHIAAYRRKRDLVVSGLSEDYELSTPGGAFYVFPKAPWGTATEFVHKAIENQLLIIPGNIFSRRDSHFRISYAASDGTLARGIEVLRKLARHKPGR
jgi:aspartate aminotransferase/aminotransferase